MLLTRRCAVLLVCAGVALTLGAAALFAVSAPSFAGARSYATERSPNSVAIGDLNGDGMPDLAIANSGFYANADANAVSVYLNVGDGSFRATHSYRTGTSPISVAIGDLNSDRKPDLVTANASTVSVLLNRREGSFQARRDYAISGPNSVTIGDLNGDGKPDLATANIYAYSVSVLAARGDGSFRAKLDYRTGRFPHSVAIGDLNGDGKPDVVTANAGPGPNTVSVLLNTPGLCTVQDARGQALPTAKRTIARANCRVGKIRRAYSKSGVKRGRVISQRPKPGRVLPNRGRVILVVSRGTRR